ncbi:MAG: hypothetical protein JG764_827 [Clostridiales bacterium]|jgi:hypothetical protein|nr:hypothetical protein [Clostridiales bacterium]
MEEEILAYVSKTDLKILDLLHSVQPKYKYYLIDILRNEIKELEKYLPDNTDLKNEHKHKINFLRKLYLLLYSV